jgi:hypothetical protein
MTNNNNNNISSVVITTRKTTRKQILKDLMRDRITVEQGLTLNQIFCEVYSDVVEKYLLSSKERSVSDDFDDNDNVAKQIEYYGGGEGGYSYYWKTAYLRRVIKQLRKTDDDFRWLSVLPVKRNEIVVVVDDKTTATATTEAGKRKKKKVRPYLEYRYINIKASETLELLEKVNKIWLKHAEAILKGLEERERILRLLNEAASTLPIEP